MIFGNSRGTYAVPRTITRDGYEWEEMFCDFLERIGCDRRGHCEKTPPTCERTEDGGLISETFEVHPYNWDFFNTSSAPNFIYHPTGLEIRWYKYPLRDSYSNQELTYNQLEDILRKCEESLAIGGGNNANEETLL